MRPALLQDLDAPVLRVRADCLVRPLFYALSHGRLPSSCWGPPPGAPRGADGACGQAAVQGVKRNADASEFSEGRPVPVGKVFAPLALERPWASLRSQSETGQCVLQTKRHGNGFKLCPLRLLLRCSKVANCDLRARDPIFYLPSVATIESTMAESSSLATAKLFLPASFSDAPTR